MSYLRARHRPDTAAFWWDVRYAIDLNEPVPTPLRELAAGARHITCDPDERDAALSWASAQPSWPSHLPDDRTPVYALNPAPE
jgi:hypothetical protein